MSRWHRLLGRARRRWQRLLDRLCEILCIRSFREKEPLMSPALRLELEQSRREREETRRTIARVRSILADIRYQTAQAEAATESLEQ